MSKSNAFETALLLLYFNATTHAELAEDDSTSPATTLTLALHTSDPGEAGDQTTNEATYTSYARITVARTSGGWTVSGDSVTNAAIASFPACTGGTNTITHFSVGTGTGDAMMYSGALTASLAVSSGITPSFAIGALSISED